MADLIAACRGIAPWQVWAVVLGQAVLLLSGGTWALRRRPRAEVSKATIKTRVLLVGALAFSSVVIAAFIIGTYEGSAAFARDQLGWGDWRQIIPWATLDAAGVAFALFAIRAVALEKSPIPAYRMAAICAGFSASMQLIQGGEQHRWQAGLFLAFLAAVGGLILHTVIEQLDSGDGTEAWRRGKNPKFGVRWLTWPTNTFCAAIAWRNYPPTAEAPTEGDAPRQPTVLDAIDNLGRVRTMKATAKIQKATGGTRLPTLSAIFPWRSARHLSAALISVRTELGQVREQARTDLDALRGQAGGQVRTEREQAQRTEAELRQNLSAATTRTGQLNTELSAARTEIQRLRTEGEQTVAGLRTELDRHRSAQPVQAAPVRPGQTGAKVNAQVIGSVRSDEQIAEELWEDYSEAMRTEGKPLSRYKVEQFGKCTARQADRVRGLLADRWAGQVGGQADRSERTDRRTGPADSEQERSA